MAVVNQQLIQEIAQGNVPVLPNNGNPAGAYNMPRANIGRGTLTERLRAKANNPTAIMPNHATVNTSNTSVVLPKPTVS